MALLDILTANQSEIQRLIGAILTGPADETAKRLAALATVRTPNPDSASAPPETTTSTAAAESTETTPDAENSADTPTALDAETAGAETAGEAEAPAADAAETAVADGDGTAPSEAASDAAAQPPAGGSDDDATAATATATTTAPPPATGKPAVEAEPRLTLRVLIAPFAPIGDTTADGDANGGNGNGKGSTDWLAEFPLARLPEQCIRHHLKLAPSVDIVTRHEYADITAEHRGATAAQLAKFAKAAVVLTGTLRRDGDDLEVAMRLDLASEHADAEPETVYADTWRAPLDAVYLHTALPTLRLVKALGVPVKLAELEKLALPLTVNPEVADFWARALTADAKGVREASMRYYQMALDAQPGFRPAVDTLEAFAQPAEDEWPAEAEKYRAAVRPLRQFRAIARQVDPSRPVWLSGVSLAERDDFSALGFAPEGTMGQGLDALIDALLELPANALVVRLVTGLLESHLCREDTPLPAKYVQWQMPLSHAGNRMLWDREQKRAYLWLCRARAELGLGHVAEAREIAKFVAARFVNLPEIAAYAEQFFNDLNQYDTPAFRAHRKETTDKFEAARPYLQRIYALLRMGEVPRNSPSSRAKSWAVERPALSWDTYAEQWEELNRLARQPQPKLVPLNPDAVEREILSQLATEWRHAVTPNAKRLAYRPMSWLGAEALDDLRDLWLVPPNEPGHFATLMAGLVRAGAAPEVERFAELVASDPLAAARFIRSLTPAVSTPDLARDLDQDLELPDQAAAAEQVTHIPDEWRPMIWQCLNSLPKSAKAEAAHLVALLGFNPRADEESRFLEAVKIAPTDAAVALLKLKCTSYPTDGDLPDDQAVWCLAWRARFKEQGPAAFVNLLPEGPGWMVVLGKQLADLVPLAMMAPTRLANEVGKLRTARGLPERDFLYIEELASGAIAADKRPQSGKVARIMLQQIIQRWPPWKLSMGDHVWLFGTLERLKMENDPESAKVVLDLGRKSVDTLLELEAPDFDERAITREKYYTDEQYLLVEILKRVVQALGYKQSAEARQVLADIITRLKLPAQGNLIPFVETALVRQGTAVLETIETWLENPEPFSLSAAQRILDRLSGPEIDDALLSWIGMDRPVFEHIAFETLRHRGPEALPLIGSMLLSPSEDVQRVACELLVRLRPQDLPDDFDFSPLVETISATTDRRLLRAACLAVAAHSVADAFEPIAVRLVEWPIEDRLELLEGVARTGQERAYPFLIRALQSDLGDESSLAYSHLLRISGQIFPKDPAPWAIWWAQTADDLALPRPANAATIRIPFAPVPTTTATTTAAAPAAGSMTPAASPAGTADAASLPAAKRPARPRVPKPGTAKFRVPRQPGKTAMPSITPDAVAKASAADDEEPPEMPELLADDIGMPEIDLAPDMPSAPTASDSGDIDFDAVPEIETDDLGAEDFQSLDGTLTKPKNFPTVVTPPAEPEDDIVDAPEPFGDLDDDFGGLGDTTAAPAASGSGADDPFAGLDAELTPDASLLSQGTIQAFGLDSASGSGSESAMPSTGPVDAFGDFDDGDDLGEIDLGELPMDGDLDDFPDEVAAPVTMRQMPGRESRPPIDDAPIPSAVPFDANPVDAFAGVEFGDEFGFGETGPEGLPGSASADDMDPAFGGATDTELFLPDPMAGDSSSLLQAPLNQVTGPFPLASLHGNGAGQWLSTDPDRFLAEGPVWFLIGNPEYQNFSFICPFHLVNGGFDVIIGPDDRRMIARIRLNTAQFKAGEWWTLMVERQGEQAWFRIAERDNDWFTLETVRISSPLAALGIAFVEGGDVAFGELVFEVQDTDDHSRSGYLVRRR